MSKEKSNTFSNTDAEEEERAFEEAYCVAVEIESIKVKIRELLESLAPTPSEIRIRDLLIKEHRRRFDELNGQFSSKSKTSAEDTVKELKLQGKEDWEIAGLVSSAYKLSTFAIGRLLPARPDTNIAPDSIRKRGSVLLQKYKEMKKVR